MKKLIGVRMCKKFWKKTSLVFSILTFSSFLFVSSAYSASSLLSSDKEKEEVAKASKSLGVLIGKKIQNSPVKLDQNKVFEGIKEALSSKPTLSEKECLASLMKMEEKIQIVLAEKNLLQASLFLQKNSKAKDIITLKKNRLQYQILQEGTGDQVQENFSPLIRYQGSLLTGEIFLPLEEQVVVLKELLPGLKTALLGMKEKEKRKIFIHPDLGYGKELILPPNSLLIFEVEIIKADKSLTNQLPQEIAEKKTL